MKRCLSLALLWTIASTVPARAEDADVNAVIDKAVTALGGEAALKKALSFQIEGIETSALGPQQIVETKFKKVIQGLHQSRLEGDLEGFPTSIRGRTVVMGRDYGASWSRKGDGSISKYPTPGGDAANLWLVLLVAPINLAPFRDGGFKIEAAGAGEVDGRATVALKFTGSEDTPILMDFDRETGLPVRQVYRPRYGPRRWTTTTIFRDYREFGGLKVATYQIQEVEEPRPKGRSSTVTVVTDFKALGKADPNLFAAPDSLPIGVDLLRMPAGALRR